MSKKGLSYTIHVRRSLLLIGVILPGLAWAQRPIDARLFEACRKGDVAAARALLAKGANPNATEANGWTPLMNPNGPPENALALAKLLIAKGDKMNAQVAGQGWTPLTNAFNGAQHSADLIHFLLTNGADPNIALFDGQTALHLAVTHGFEAAVVDLLAHGARINSRTHQLAAPPHEDSFATDGYRLEAAQSQARIDHTFEPGFRFSGCTALFGLQGDWNRKIAEILLRSGAKLSDTDDNGWTVLHYATKFGYLPSIVGLLALGADPNAASKEGFRPLHVAMRVGFGFPDIAAVRALLAASANPMLKNAAGQTPLDLMRADVERSLGNPTHDPALRFSAAERARYLQMANEVARLLDPKAPPIHVDVTRPDPKGTRYAPLTFADESVERVVRLENGRAILELEFPATAKAPYSVAITALSLENYDTLTPLPVRVMLSGGKAQSIRFDFPVGAAKGGGVFIEYNQEGPGDSSGGGSTGDEANANPGFEYSSKAVSVTNEIEGRTLLFEIVSVTRSGKSVPGLAGRTIRVEGGKPEPIPGLHISQFENSKSPKTTIRYRYRLLPNTKWHTETMDLP